jgi:hypothetical protein
VSLLMNTLLLIMLWAGLCGLMISVEWLVRER